MKWRRLAATVDGWLVASLWLEAAAALLSPTGTGALAPASLPYGDHPYVAPNPYVVWIDSGVLPTTPPPVFGQCHGCQCVHLLADAFVSGGHVAKQYRCTDSHHHLVPSLKWSGFDGASDISFAVTITDLDEPDGVGALSNHVSALFWAANIPGDWRGLDDSSAAAGGIVIGRNRGGGLGLEPICPHRGRHRLSITLWVLHSSVPGLGPDAPYSEVVQQLEAAELARDTLFADVSADGEALLELSGSRRGPRSLRGA